MSEQLAQTSPRKDIPQTFYRHDRNMMKKHKLRLSSVMHIVLLLVAAILLLGQLPRKEKAEDLRRLQFFGDYSRDGISWHPYEGQRLSALEGDLYLRGDFGMQFPEKSTITFYAFHISVDVALNGVPLCTMAENALCNSQWISIETPYVGTEDQFTFHLSNSHNVGNAHSYIRLMDRIYYGDRGAVRQIVEDGDAVRRTIGITVIALSLALMGLALVFGVMGLHENPRLLPIGLMALCYGGYLLLTGPSISFGVSKTEILPCMLFLCIIVALMELSVLLRAYLTDLRRKIVGVILSLQLLWLLVLLTGALVGRISMCRFLDLWVPLQVGAMAVILSMGIWEWHLVSHKQQGFLISCGCLFGAALLESLNEWLLLWGERLILDSVVALFFFAYAVYGIVSVPLSIRKAAQAERLQSDLNQNRIVLAMSQIRAHFIFNILNAISGMCKYDPEKADATLIRFARYLRGNINVMQEDKLEVFAASLQQLQDYIALEQVRFGDRIRFRTDTPVKDFYLPPLVIQPLVENAIKHGLTPKKEGGTITLRTEQRGDRILITVADDGVGFSAEDAAKKDSVGLSNVRFRLKQLVDGEVRVESTPGEGTLVTLTLPLERVRLGK